MLNPLAEKRLFKFLEATTFENIAKYNCFSVNILNFELTMRNILPDTSCSQIVGVKSREKKYSLRVSKT